MAKGKVPAPVKNKTYKAASTRSSEEGTGRKGPKPVASETDLGMDLGACLGTCESEGMPSPERVAPTRPSGE